MVALVPRLQSPPLAAVVLLLLGACLAALYLLLAGGLPKVWFNNPVPGYFNWPAFSSPFNS
ncbi:hypothetical protein [Halioxenophilus sp. WMMB6]|uniref:hypothetical protein n=1 Tax=Halioxenophilus sp. WMMB6 TaxID=3073815 RepID=UPI00295F4EB7|nr:hypothetical protein [Halioxenophilus sp. WMMB6]